MKLSRSAVAGLFVVGFVVLSASASFADGGNEKGKVKLLSEAAIALQQSNPGLSAALTKFANEEASEVESEKSEKKELEGKAEQEKMSERQEHIKLFRDAAAALTKSNPDLAQRLSKAADHSAKSMEKKEGKEDKEEAGEKEENGQINKK